jgi:hypothetical protein
MRTSISIEDKDRDYLKALTKKNKKIGMWATVESIINLIKKLKLEKELE